MATVIDTLFFELGMKGDLAKEAEKAESALDKLETKIEEVEKKTGKATKATNEHTKKQEKTNKTAKSLHETLTKFTKAVGAVTVALIAGTGLDKLAREAAAANVELSNTSKNLGMSTNSLSAWRGAIDVASGSAEGITGYIQSLSDGLMRMTVMGDTSITPFFNTLGISLLDSSGRARDYSEILLDLADAFSTMDRPMAASIASNMGMDDGTFNVLVQGRSEVEKLLKQQEKLYRSNAKEIENSRKLAQSQKMLGQQYNALKLMLGNALTPVLLKVSQYVEGFFNFLMRNEDLVKGVFLGISGAIGLVLLPVLAKAAMAALAFFSPFLLGTLVVLGLALAFGVLYEDYEKWANGGESLFKWGEFIGWFDKANFSVGSLAKGFIKLLTGYKSMDEVIEDASDWLEKKGFTQNGKMTLESLGNGFKQLGKDIYEYAIKAIGKLGEIISALMDGEFKKAFNLAVDFVWNDTPVGYLPKKIYEHVTDKENVAEAADIAAQVDPNDKNSMSSIVKDKRYLNNSSSFTGNLDPNWSDEEKAMFLAQAHHESGGFKYKEEKLKYSFERLKYLRDNDKNFSSLKKYDDSTLLGMSKDKELFANNFYGGRLGNEKKGDGYKYRGRGYLQITGKSNYKAIGDMIGVDLVNNPDLLISDENVAMQASVAWWNLRKKNDKKFRNAVENQDILTVSKAVNGGTNGLEERKKLTAKYLGDLKNPSSIEVPNANWSEPLLAGLDSHLKTLNQPIGGNAVASAINAALNMTNMVKPQNINNTQQIQVVVNDGINVNSSSPTISGTFSDGVQALADRTAAMMQVNYGVN